MSKAQFYYKNKNAPKPNKPNSIGIAAIIKFNDKVLLEKRVDSDRWSLIGGGLEVIESLEEGIVREIKEETGLNINDDHLKFWKIYSDPSRIASFPDGNILRLITAVYIVKLNKAHKLLCSEESEELRYFNLNELKYLNIAETHKHIIEDYINEGN
ncbi:NUDIX domain-containing protein [Clostridium tertium]|uniref:Nucleoside triphosphatase NudI n=1 Tax=Clostridium tertium TaxID=1559 RepID=A0A6N2Y824_9CLOT